MSDLLHTENKSWIALLRKIKDDPMWIAERFTKGQAWVDLLLHANFSDKGVMIGNKIIIVKRGSLLTSQANLARRWDWNRKTVKAFLEACKTDNRLDYKTDRDIQHGNTVITIINYNKYQYSKQQDGQQNEQQSTQEKGQLSIGNTDTNNNDNKKKKSNNKTNRELERTVSHYIELFKPINPSYKQLLTKKTEKEAIMRLLSDSKEKLDSYLPLLSQIKSKQYAPVITKPTELEDKLGKLEDYLLRNNLITSEENNITQATELPPEAKERKEIFLKEQLLKQNTKQEIEQQKTIENKEGKEGIL